MTVELTADEFTIHAQETVSTGEYESYKANATIEGSVAHVGTLDNGTQRELKARLLALERDVQEAVERACENRIREDGHENWGVEHE